MIRTQEKTTQRFSTKNLILAALFLALGILLPMLFHAISLGSAFLPMHIPVLICGFICGWRYGAVVGGLIPLLSALLTGMPPFFPMAVSMMFELIAYGAMTGLLGKRMPIYPALVLSMLAGRVVAGCADAILLGLGGTAYGFSTFITAFFITSLPGIILQLVLIPILLYALQRAGVLPALRKNGSSEKTT